MQDPLAADGESLGTRREIDDDTAGVRTYLSKKVSN